MTASRQWTIGATMFVAFAGMGAIRWRGAVPDIPRRDVAFGTVPRPMTDSLDAALAAAEDFTVTNDAFRISNTPSSVRFDPGTDGGSAGQGPVPPPAPRPIMTLKAIVGGPPWQAIIDGIPGQPPGTMVRAGAAFDKLVARAVTRDSVIMQGPDTTWVLSFRRKE